MIEPRYIPTPQEIAQTKLAPEHFKVSGDGSFFTIQGEGASIGKPAIFLRLHFCNLQCSWCDTKYTWDSTQPAFWQENANWDIPQTVQNLRAYAHNRLVITGGEPLIQQNTISALLNEIPDWDVEIETNGTILPNQEIAGRCQLNVSPKLGNSDNSKPRRFKPDVLHFMNGLERTAFKFVVTSLQDLEEIQQIVDECALDPNKIIIMPEGKTDEEIREHALAVVDHVKDKGWRLLPRLQVTLWGNQRGV